MEDVFKELLKAIISKKLKEENGEGHKFFAGMVPKNAEQEKEFIDAKLAKHKMIVVGVHAGCDHPEHNFNVTISMTNFKSPELVSFILHPSMATEFFNDLTERIKAGTLTLTDGLVLDDISTNLIAFKTVAAENVPNFFGHTLERFADQNPQFMQMVLSDKNNKFPWDADYDAEYMKERQPELWVGTDRVLH